MHIALTADPELPVPPIHYGGIERIIDMLAKGLVARGHEVTIFAHPDSQTSGFLVPWRGRNSRSKIDTLMNAATLGVSAAIRPVDLIHSFSRIAYLTPLLPLPIPKLMTYQREISRRSIQMGHALSRGSLWFTAISRWMMRGVEDIGTWRLVFNGVPLATYRFSAQCDAGAPLVFLGRIEEIKGPHLAIEIARRTGIPLVIAGNLPDAHRAWFTKWVEPHIDGERISYIGPVNDEQKSQLLRSARALLMPILWDEPFGIVMPEAMACGTPVIGMARGAVPEVVEDGITGFVASTLEGLVDAVGRLHEIDRLNCRRRVEHLFSENGIVDQYVAVYDEMIARRGS
jgi:glycosyltransferase involved in cell wall biosynthesis